MRTFRTQLTARVIEGAVHTAPFGCRQDEGALFGGHIIPRRPTEACSPPLLGDLHLIGMRLGPFDTLNLSIQPTVWMEILGTKALGQFPTRALREGQSHSKCGVFLSCVGTTFTVLPTSTNPAKLQFQRAAPSVVTADSDCSLKAWLGRIENSVSSILCPKQMLFAAVPHEELRLVGRNVRFTTNQPLVGGLVGALRTVLVVGLRDVGLRTCAR